VGEPREQGKPSAVGSMRAMALFDIVMSDCESRQGVVEIHCFRGGREPVEDAPVIYDNIDGGKPIPSHL